MPSDLIHDRGRGPEIAGTRITVYDLLPYFYDPTATEAYVCALYELTPEQVAAARAYAFENAETVLTEHLEIEALLAVGNPPDVTERAARTRATFLSFKHWLVERRSTEARQDALESATEPYPAGSGRLPTFREWFAERQLRSARGA